MKMLFSALLLTVIHTNAAHAAPAAALQAVLGSEAFQQATQQLGQDVTNVRESALFRCPGCFEFEVSLGRGDTAQIATFMTSGRPSPEGMQYSVSRKGSMISEGRCFAVGRVGGEDVACAQHKSRNACISTAHWERCNWASH